MHSLTWTGTAAEVRWGYYTAAVLSKWALTGQTLTATVVRVDAFKVSQQPLTLVVPRAQGAWTWSIDTLQITGTSLSASLCP